MVMKAQERLLVVEIPLEMMMRYYPTKLWM